MSIHIIIDGYNLIRQSPRLSRLDQMDIQRGREALIDDLAAYKKLRSHRITVIFDGTNAPDASPARDRRKGIRLLFSRQGETADTVIRHMVEKEREKAMVVSSDREVAAAAERNGAASIPSRDFDEKLAAARMMGDIPDEEAVADGWVPTTRKKGPHKRLPKRSRRNLAKIRKL